MYKVSIPTCELCLLGKAHRKLCKELRAAHPLDLTHSNICGGPKNVKSHHDVSYFLTLINDYSQRDKCYLSVHRFEALDCLKHFVKEIETQIERNKNIKD